jgi:HAMP domain-containing protein
VGGLFVLHDFTSSHRAIRAAMVQTLFVMVAFALATAAALILAIRFLVFRRIARLADRVESAADQAGTPPERIVQVGAHDKLIRLEALFERVIHANGRTANGGALQRAGTPGKDPPKPKV